MEGFEELIQGFHARDYFFIIGDARFIVLIGVIVQNVVGVLLALVLINRRVAPAAIGVIGVDV